MTAVLLTAPRIRFLDSNGAPLVGGKIYTYLAGTTTPQATFTDASGLTPNANPVILDSAGYADIWISGSYKIVVHDSSDNLISSTDNITGFTTGAVGATFLDGAFVLQNSSDPTKQVTFNLAAVGSGNTVQIGVPNGNFTLVNTALPQTYTAAQRQAIVTLTDSATITPDFSLGNNYQVQLGGNRTIANPTNIVAGQSGNLAIFQDATGTRTVSWGWGWMAPSNGSLPTLQTAGGSVDILKYTVAAYNTANVTITLATPGVVSFTNHGFLLGQQVQLTTTGALPTGLSASTTYYVVPISSSTFSLAASLVNAAAGTTIATSGSQSGVHTLTGLSISLTAAISTAVTDATIITTDTTTNNVSTSKHGWTPKLPNNALVYLNGVGAYTSPLTLGTPTTFNSATTYNITGLPAGIKQLNMILQGVTLSGNAEILFQIGDPTDGLKTSAYISFSAAITSGGTGTSSSTAGMLVHFGASTPTVLSNSITFELVDAVNNVWSSKYIFTSTTDGGVYVGGGQVTLSAPLDRITFTTAAGSVTWTAGKISISYM